MDKVDAIVVGAGVVGLAVAAKLSQYLTKVLIIDKNTGFGEETSSRNSEVIHAGLYYPKNSLKARCCVEGKAALYQYCQQRHIPYQRIGKLLVAHDEAEQLCLENTLSIAQGNGVDDLCWLTANQVNILEPAISARAALLSPSTGIIDVHSYMQSLLVDLEQHQGMFVGNTRLLRAEPNEQGFVVDLLSGDENMRLNCQYLINSAGLHSTAVADLIVGLSAAHIPILHWCRGHYFSYSGKSPFKHLIYPVPETNGLGIHASLDVGGQLKFGPDTEYVTSIDYTVDMALKNKFYEAVKLYFPTLEYERLQPAYAGIRPKLQGPNDSFMDFSIQAEQCHQVPGLINLFGIDSPGLTSSLAIAEQVSHLLDLSN
jgi:L-2-hydroxyglutarate oxidase LhgO